MSKRLRRVWWVMVVLLPGSVVWGMRHWDSAVDSPVNTPSVAIPVEDGMARLPVGRFAMGSPDAALRDGSQALRRLGHPLVASEHEERREDQDRDDGQERDDANAPVDPIRHLQAELGGRGG